jgi:Fe-S-cluster containining protein
MLLYRKVQAVLRVFRTLSRRTDEFQKNTRVSCIKGCGACCTKEDIEASTLEFLPLAYHLFKQGRAMGLLETLSADQGPICIFFNRDENDSKPGKCTVHPYRGLICRLFGFSGTLDREGKIHYATCRHIKERDMEHFVSIDEAVGNERISIPVGPHYYLMLNAVDPSLMAYHPINLAIKKAIETVLGYYTYRRRRCCE